jgi:NDP-sugar pyrophosphorylase family protein
MVFVTSLVEKPAYDVSVTMGNMMINKKGVSNLVRMVKGTPQLDLTKNFVPALIEKGMRVASYYVNDFWYDEGTVEKYLGLEDKTVEKQLGFLGH